VPRIANGRGPIRWRNAGIDTVSRSPLAEAEMWGPLLPVPRSNTGRVGPPQFEILGQPAGEGTQDLADFVNVGDPS